jgi:hypothetical protein
MWWASRNSECRYREAGRSKHRIKVKNRQHPAMDRVMDTLSQIKNAHQQRSYKLILRTAFLRY